MNIFEALRKDHDIQRTMIDRLLETEGASDSRRDRFADLERELAAHAAAEERHFYAPLMEHDRTQEQARHSVAEHHELDELLERLEGHDMSSSAWIETARELGDRLVHHLAEEEHEVFQQAGKVLTADEKEQLATTYAHDMDRHRRA